MRRILILFAFAITSASLLSANQGATYSDNDDFRAKGLIIRPELYGALLVDIGYQINPRLQVSFGFHLRPHRRRPSLRHPHQMDRILRLSPWRIHLAGHWHHHPPLHPGAQLQELRLRRWHNAHVRLGRKCDRPCYHPRLQFPVLT